jgi:hypothetical protein
LVAIGVAAAVAAVAYVAHARDAGVGEVAGCLRHAGARVQPARAAGWTSLVRRGDGVYAIDLRGDQGTLLRIGRGVGTVQVQRTLDAAGTHVTSQSDGRILVLWSGRPRATSAAALNRCLRA